MALVIISGIVSISRSRIVVPRIVPSVTISLTVITIATIVLSFVKILSLRYNILYIVANLTTVHSTSILTPIGITPVHLYANVLSVDL